jgi:predicted dehydrogenase
MAQKHAKEFNQMANCELVAACDLDADRVDKFSLKHSIPSTFTDVDRLLKECPCDAVSVVTPDPSHCEISLKVIAAGKHILCEKPLALNYEDAAKMRDAAHKAGVINMVNFSYRNSSAIQKASALVASGALGVVRHVSAHYHQSWLAQDAWGDWRSNPSWLWRLSKAHGSAGALGDLGIHLLDFASMPLGGYKNVSCRTKTFEKQSDSAAAADYTFDANDTALITAEFSNGALGTLQTTRWAYPHVNSMRLELYGDQASIEIDLNASYSTLKMNRILGRDIMPWETVECGSTPNNYQRFVQSIISGQQDQPDFARGAEMQAVLDACHESSINDKTILITDTSK